MSRVHLAAAALTVILFASTGCSDADSTRDSSGSTSASSIGAVGDCYAAATVTPVDCSAGHVAQTVYVTNAPIDDSSGSLVPCRAAQAKFLGQDFNTRLDLRLWVASDGSWSRCDVLVRTSTAGSDHYQMVTRSLEDAFESDVPVEYQACLAEAFDPSLDQRYIGCTERHASQELTVAPVLAPLDEPFPADVAERAANACNASAAAADQINPHQSVVAFYPQDAAAWATGERTADCWVIANEGTLPPLTEGD